MRNAFADAAALAAILGREFISPEIVLLNTEIDFQHPQHVR